MIIDKTELVSYLTEDIYCEGIDIDTAVSDAVGWEVKDEYGNEELDELQSDVEAVLDNMLDNPEDYVTLPIYISDIRKIWEENENEIDEHVEAWMFEDCDTIGDMIDNAVHWWLLTQLNDALYEIRENLNLEDFINESATA